MATVAHCLFAFETLAAHLEDREPTPLATVQKSWSAYARNGPKHGDGPATTTTTGAKMAKKPPALRRLAAASLSSASSSSASSSSSSSTTSLPHPQPQARSSGADTPATSVESIAGEEDEHENENEDEVEDEDGDDQDKDNTTETPLFVTWNADSGRHGYTLRGCIGTFEAQPLEEGLSSYALTAALHDTRFRPVGRRELPGLEVAVTLLTDFEDAADAMDWTLGTHGLRVSFHDGGRRYGATYLPDVASEQGWSKEETLISLMRKAGWPGAKDRWRDVELKVVRYQGRKRRLEYAEYKRWRDWADERAKEQGQEREQEHGRR